MECRGLEKLNDAVYLAQKGDEKRRGAQIVFIRGLQFQKDKNQFPDNWLSEDGNDLWPKSWLSQSFPTAAIYLVDYDSSTSKNDRKGRLDMFITAESLLHNLILAKIGQSPRNPVILIGQDIGGLVIKEICLRAFLGASLDTGDTMHQEKRSFLQQVKGVFYYSTPHNGILHWDQDNQGELMKSLRVYNPATSRTNDDFRKMRTQFNWRSFGLGTSHQGRGQVEEASARYDVDQFCMISASTSDICRPKDRTSSSFLLLETFIQKTLSGIKKPNRVKLPFRDDPKYVPLKQTVREIRQRLEDPDVQVVVLYGDAGTGKSSLTKYLALEYELEEESGRKSTFWDGIFFFECGRGKKAVTVLRNMLHKLDVDLNIFSSDDEDRMLCVLSERLQKLNALMIFDDVWEEDRKSLVEKVVVSEAREVKYLLSSQQFRGWRGYSTYKIEDISVATAQQIIIKNVGLPDEEIPRDHEKIVNDIIKMTECHPLALATISSSVQVNRERRMCQKDWKDLRQNLLVYLAEDEPSAKATIFGKQYPRSVFAAMMYAVDLLCERKDESLYLLCIMALFKSPFPASLVHMVIFCTRSQLSKDVYRLIKRLQDRQLVQRTVERQIENVQPFPHNPYVGIVTDVSDLRMHGLRQQFILSCAGHDFGLKDSVEVIKETVSPFLSRTGFGGAHEFEHRAEHPSPAVLITAFCALYGIADVKNAAAERFWNYQLKIPVEEDASSKVELPMAPDITECEHTVSISTFPYRALLYRAAMSSRFFHTAGIELSDSRHPRIALEVLMAHIDDPEHSSKENIQSALQKLVWKYMFQLRVDDDSLSFLISEGYPGALAFLSLILNTGMITNLDHLGHSTDDHWDPISRSLAAATRLLRTEAQSYSTSLVVLNLLRDLAMIVQISSGKVYVDAFDLEVLINVFNRVHVDSPDNFYISSTLIQLFDSLADDVRIGFQLICRLGEGSGIQEGINSVIDKLVAELNSNRHLELLESSNSKCIDSMNLPLLFTVYQVDTVLKAMRLLCKLWPQTVREENVIATLRSISKPLEALLRAFAYQPLGAEYFYQCVHDLHWTYLFETYGSVPNRGREDQIGRSVIWCIPGATQALVSFVTRRRPSSGPIIPLDAAEVGLRLLADRTSSTAVYDDGVRSYFFTEGFVDMLVEYIEDFTAKIFSGSWIFGVHGGTAVRIIENSVTTDETAASSCASLPKLHRVLCDILSCASTETCTCTWYCTLTVLLYLGCRIGVNDHMRSSRCCILQAISPKHFHSADVELSHAMKVADAFESLFKIIDNNGHTVAQVAALTLLRYLLQRHSSARDRIYAMPTTAMRLSVLLHGNDEDVQKLALGAIVELSIGSHADAANGFLGQVKVIPGVLERIVEFMVHDWGGRESALRFVRRYLELYPHPESASRIWAVRGFGPGIVLSLQNKDDDMRNGRYTLEVLSLLSSAAARGSPFFLLPFGGSVEALVELSYHLTHKLVEQPGSLQLVGSDKKQEREDFLVCIYTCLGLLGQLADESEETASRIVACERVFDSIIYLFDDKQMESKQEESCADLDHWQENCKWSAIKFVLRLVGLKRNAIPEKIIELVSRALQDRVDLLTNINGAQVPGVLESLRSLLSLMLKFKESRSFIARALGSVESLIPLCVHHEQRIARADALHVLRQFLLTLCSEDIHALTRYLLKVLDVFPAIVDQLQQCLLEQEDSVKLQSENSVVHFFAFLASVANSTGPDLIHLNSEIRSHVRSKLASILDNPQVVQNLIGLADGHERFIHHEFVMYVLNVAADTVNGLRRIMQIPGTLQRIVNVVYRGDLNAFRLVYMWIFNGRLYASAPRYLLKCLCHVVSARMGNDSASRALQVLGVCALRNQNALHYLINMLHKSVRCTLRAEAMHHLICHVSDNAELPTRTLLASLQSLAYDPTQHERLGPADDLQRQVLCELVSLVERSPKSYWRIAKYVTGLSAHDLRKGSMDTTSSELIPPVNDEARSVYYYFYSCFLCS